MDVYLIRHTEVAVGRGICYGQADVALAANYPQQRDRLRHNLPPRPDRIWASPLTRCRQLADDLAVQPNAEPLAISYDDRLKEYHFGDWEELPWADIPPDGLNPWMADFVNVCPPNGETFQQLYARARAFWETEILPVAGAAAQSPALPGPAQVVFVVTHGGVIRALLCLFLELSLHNAYRINLDYGAVTKLTITDSSYLLQYINR